MGPLRRVLGLAISGQHLLVQEAAQELQEQLGDPAAVVLLGATQPSKVSMVAAFSPQVGTPSYHADA